MFTEIDKILYPNRCEVMEVAPQRFVFPIFKNGSSSLRAQAKKDNWKILFNEQIQRCDKIEVYLREPESRIASGAGSYYDDMSQWSKGLDPKTIIEFMEQYFFLNRHYLPQIHWLVWLGRYLRSDTVLSLRDIKRLSEITDYDIKGDRIEYPTKITHLSRMPNCVFYIELDQCLYRLKEREMSLSEILIEMRDKHKHAYEHVFGHAKRLSDVLP